MVIVKGDCARQDISCPSFYGLAATAVEYSQAKCRTGTAACKLGGGKMSEENDSKRSEADAELEREVREGRKFTLEEAIARMAGPGGMKGVSPIPRMEQASIEIETWLGNNLIDGGGALRVVLQRHVKGSELLLKNFEAPLVVLATYCRQVLDSECELKELVRDADFEWGRVMSERPYFDKEGSPCNPEDPYTADSVRHTLTELMQQLAASF
jgi:hypothetical protein